MLFLCFWYFACLDILGLLFHVVNTTAIDCLQRSRPQNDLYVSRGTLSTCEFTHSVVGGPSRDLALMNVISHQSVSCVVMLSTTMNVTVDANCCVLTTAPAVCTDAAAAAVFRHAE